MSEQNLLCPQVPGRFVDHRRIFRRNSEWHTPLASSADEQEPRGPFGQQLRNGLFGVTFPLALIACTALGIWLMFSRMAFGTSGTLADSDHLLGALAVTVSVIALTEPARALRFLNLPMGLWIAASPFVLSGASGIAVLNNLVVGLAITGLSLRRAAVAIIATAGGMPTLFNRAGRSFGVPAHGFRRYLMRAAIPSSSAITPNMQISPMPIIMAVPIV